jgi:hypothetical protein
MKRLFADPSHPIPTGSCLKFPEPFRVSSIDKLLAHRNKAHPRGLIINLSLEDAFLAAAEVGGAGLMQLSVGRSRGA